MRDRWPHPGNPVTTAERKWDGLCDCSQMSTQRPPEEGERVANGTQLTLTLTLPTSTSRAECADRADVTNHVDPAVSAVLDTSDDPTGAAIVWPLLMLPFYGLLGLAFFIIR